MTSPATSKNIKDMNYNEKLKELTEKFILEMESLKSKNQLLKIEKEKDSARYEETFKLSEDKHNQVKWVRSKVDGLEPTGHQSGRS